MHKDPTLIKAIEMENSKRTKCPFCIYFDGNDCDQGYFYPNCIEKIKGFRRKRLKEIRKIPRKPLLTL